MPFTVLTSMLLMSCFVAGSEERNSLHSWGYDTNNSGKRRQTLNSRLEGYQQPCDLRSSDPATNIQELVNSLQAIANAGINLDSVQEILLAIISLHKKMPNKPKSSNSRIPEEPRRSRESLSGLPLLTKDPTFDRKGFLFPPRPNNLRSKIRKLLKARNFKKTLIRLFRLKSRKNRFGNSNKQNKKLIRKFNSTQTSNKFQLHPTESFPRSYHLPHREDYRAENGASFPATDHQKQLKHILTGLESVKDRSPEERTVMLLMPKNVGPFILNNSPKEDDELIKGESHISEIPFEVGSNLPKEHVDPMNISPPMRNVRVVVDDGTEIFRENIVISPDMKIHNALQQAAVKYGGHSWDDYNPFYFNFEPLPSSRCYTIKNTAKPGIRLSNYWRISVIDENGQELWNDRCLPGSDEVSLRPGYIIIVKYTLDGQPADVASSLPE